MDRKVSRPVLLFTLTVLMPFLLLEFSLRFVAFAWQPVYQTIFDNPNHTYIYILGESTSKGQPYQAKINPAILISYQFNDSLQGKPIEIIDLAQFGQTIEYNYFKFYFDLLFRPHKNALVFIYSGINEAIENTPDEHFASWEKIQHSIILSKLLSGCFTNSPRKYKYRYEQVLALAQSHGYKTVISQLVGNVTGYDPVVLEGDDLLKPECIDSFTKANALLAKTEYAKAENIYKTLLTKLHYDHPYLIYCIAHCMYQQHQYDSAKFYFNHLPEICNYTGYAHWKNEIIAEVANRPDVALAHTYERFADSSENGLVGYNLITDEHHPNLRGYCIMSRELAGEVSKLYGEKIKRNISEDIVQQHFNFDNKFWSRVDYIVVEWFIYEAFETQMRESRIATLNSYIARYEQLNPNDEITLLWKLLVVVMQKDEKQINFFLHQINICNRRKEMIMRLQGGFANKSYKKEIINTIGAVHLANKEDVGFVGELISALR